MPFIPTSFSRRVVDEGNLFEAILELFPRVLRKEQVIEVKKLLPLLSSSYMICMDCTTGRDTERALLCSLLCWR